MKSLLHLLPDLSRYRLPFWLGIGGLLLARLFEVPIPLYLRDGIDSIANGEPALLVPSLAIGYSVGVLMVFESGRARTWAAWFANPGRMTLTHYLMQSAIGIVVFYGHGFGAWGRIGAV